MTNLLLQTLFLIPMFFVNYSYKKGRREYIRMRSCYLNIVWYLLHIFRREEFLQIIPEHIELILF